MVMVLVCQVRNMGATAVRAASYLVYHVGHVGSEPQENNRTSVFRRSNATLRLKLPAS